MTLEALYYVSQIVAVAAVLASLIFVGIQIRQNTDQAKRNEEAIKSAATEAAHRSFLDWYYNQTPESAAIFAKSQENFESFGVEERFFAFAMMMPLLMNLQEAHSKWVEGALVEDRWRFWDQFAGGIVLSPGILHVWKLRHYMFSDGFQVYFNDKIKNRNNSLQVAQAWDAFSKPGDTADPETLVDEEPDT